MKAQQYRTRILPLTWVVSLLLLLGSGAPSFYDTSVGPNRNPVHQEEKYRLRNITQGTFRVSFKCHHQFSIHPEVSSVGLAFKHSINTTLTWHISKIHVLPLYAKLGSHQKKFDYYQNVSFYPVG